jgi:radical SAM protein with 4Fe4S-binding SPASM domain
MCISRIDDIRNAKDVDYSVLLNITVHSIKSIIDQVKDADFQTYWDIMKDKTKVCKDCEFRYMCIDKRKPKKSKSGNLWEFDTDCEYNPYSAEWKG